MFDLSSVSAITIPEGDVLSICQVTDSGEEILLWERGRLDQVSVIYYDSPSATLTFYSWSDFSECSAALSQTSYSYSGDGDSYQISAIDRPIVTVTDPDGTILSAGADFMVSYSPVSGEIYDGQTSTLTALVIPAQKAFTGFCSATYTAKYTKSVPVPTAQYMFSFGGENGTVTGTVDGNTATSGQEYDANSGYSLTANPDAGYAFLFWDSTTTNQIPQNPVTGTLTEDMSYKARFVTYETCSGHPFKSSSSSTILDSPSGTSYRWVSVDVYNGNSSAVMVKVTGGGNTLCYQSIAAGATVHVVATRLTNLTFRLVCSEPNGTTNVEDKNVTVTVTWLNYQI